MKGTIINGFTTSAGTDWLKLRDKSGGIYHVKKGEGRQSRESYAAANRHFEYAIRIEGELPPEMRQASTLQELEDMTNIPFTQDFIQAIRGREAESKAEKRRAEGNRWYGFKEAIQEERPGLSDQEAAKEYLKFRRMLDEAETPQERAILKDRYNLGGS